MPIRRTYTDIKVDGKSRLSSATPINDFSATSIAGSFLDIIASESDRIYSDIEYLHRALDPTRNYGVELDNLGYMLGVSRTSAFSALDDSRTNFNFYIDPRTNMNITQLINNLYPGTGNQTRQKLAAAGYINSVNNPTELTIPAGTNIYNNNKTIEYTTLNTTKITNDSKGYAGVTASVNGSFSNVQSSTLVNMI